MDKCSAVMLSGHKPQVADAVIEALANQLDVSGIRLRRDSWVSVMYAEELNSGKSSVTLQSTDRHGILGQKSSHFQVLL